MGLYIPPLFIYLCVAMGVYLILGNIFEPMIEQAWHPGLFRFFSSIIVLSLLFLYL
ncbi:DUF1656 domain-containing protein [Pseudomonas veronii]|uniref:DUF1656 domain-containing protein n=1 Tax=Pseudomonas veronii TaxID=76761 RepID=UPI002D769090|nr:DUF1656 domain-containing protein [Pseudomonas veronii]WRU65953.1 DUF1656 domain-containing protein [Pseudomonas veronii]